MKQASDRHIVRWFRENTNFHTLLIASLIFFLSLIAGCGGGDTGENTISGKSVTLAWEAPTENADGSDLTDLAGFKLYYGTSSRSYSNPINIGNTTTYTVSGLQAGTYYFAVTAYDYSGNESDYSDEAIANIE